MLTTLSGVNQATTANIILITSTYSWSDKKCPPSTMLNVATATAAIHLIGEG